MLSVWLDSKALLHLMYKIFYKGNNYHKTGIICLFLHVNIELIFLKFDPRMR